MRDFDLLLKPNWFASDIAKYYNCADATAQNIKAVTERTYGCVPIDKGKKNRAVRADDVIKIMGGVDRVTEARIYYSLVNSHKNYYELTTTTN